MSSVIFLAVEFAHSHQIEYGVRNIAAQPSPTHFMEKSVRERKIFPTFSFHGGFTASRHASIVVISREVSSSIPGPIETFVSQ